MPEPTDPAMEAVNSTDEPIDPATDPADPAATTAPPNAVTDTTTDTATDTTGVTSPLPDPTPTSAPALTPPHIESPLEDADVHNDVVVKGTVDHDGTVNLYDGEALIASGTASAGAFEVSAHLEDGAHSLWVNLSNDTETSDPSNTVSVHADQDVEPDTTATPSTDPSDAAPAGTSPLGDTDTPDVSQGEDVPDAPEITEPSTSASISGPVQIRGTGANTDTIEIYDGTKQLNVNPVTVADGQWSYLVDLEPGEHTFTAYQRNRAGTLSDTSAEVAIEVTSVPPMPSEDEPDARFAHFLEHHLLHPRAHFGWDLFAELRLKAREWIAAKGLDESGQ